MKSESWAQISVAPEYEVSDRGRVRRLEIKQRSTGARGEQRGFAREYGIGSVTIHNILRGKTWKHVGGE